MIIRAIFAAWLFAFLACANAQTPQERLFEAIEEGKPLVAEGIVARGGVKLDARNAERETPLHRAIEKGMKELAAMLVKAGAPVNARSMNSETPLHLAALHADPWFVDLLLDAKADPKLRNDDGGSALQGGDIGPFTFDSLFHFPPPLLRGGEISIVLSGEFRIDRDSLWRGMRKSES